VGDARLHYLDSGAMLSESPPIVLIHGNPGSVADYDRLISVLKTNHRVIAIDRPGHGYSERPDVRAATPSAQARAIHAALEELGVHRPVIVGHSWGGAVALAYALDFPADVAGLALLATRAYPVDTPPDALYVMLRRPVIGPLLRHTLIPVLGRGTLETRFANAYRPDTIETSALTRARALWMRPSQLAATVWDTQLLQDESASLARRYSTISLPVMLLVGDSDTLLPESQQLATQLPNAWIEILPKTGHYITRTRVADVRRAIVILEARMKAAETAGTAGNDGGTNSGKTKSQGDSNAR
jgi:pimeloyl-ACP methyl ester carboxylesterase